MNLSLTPGQPWRAASRRLAALAPPLVCALSLAGASAAEAREPVEIPINVGFGPAFFVVTGPLQDDQAPHFGLQLDVAAIINKEIIRKNRKKIPRKLRGAVSRADQIKISKIYVPDHLFISPRTDNTAMFGVTFEPLSLTLPLLRGPVRLEASAGLIASYIFIDTEFDDPDEARDSKLPEGTTHFLRPGVDLKAELTIPLSDALLVSFGWGSGLYVPQKLGGGILEGGELEESIFHIGRGFAMLHLRFPYSTRL